MNADDCREIDGFPGYRVGADGSVWSSKRPGVPRWRLMKPRRAGRGIGHLVVDLFRDRVGHHRYVHSLVLNAFVGPRPDGMEACHKNGDPTDNRIENLRWDTHKANIGDAVSHGVMPKGAEIVQAKLNDTLAQEALALHGDGWSQRRIADKFGVCQTTIQLLVRGVTWRHIDRGKPIHELPGSP